MKKNLRALASIAILAIAALYIYISGAASTKTLETLEDADLKLWLTTIPLSATLFLLLGLQMKASLHPLLKNLSASTAFHVSASNTLLNYFPAKAGTLTRGLYLNKNHGIPYRNYAESLILSSCITIFISAFLLFAAANFNQQLKSTFKKLYATFEHQELAFTVTIILSVASIIFIMAKKNEAVSKVLKTANRGNLLQLLITSLALFSVNAIRLYLCFLAVGYKPSTTEIVFIQAAVNLSFLISVTPGNMAIKESVLVIASGCALIDPKTALLAGVLDRLSALIPTFAIGPVSCTNLAKSHIKR